MFVRLFAGLFLIRLVLFFGPEPETKPYRLHDAMPAYWEFLRQNAGSGPESAGKRFDASVVRPHREVFTAVAAGWLSETNLDRLVRSLEGQSEQLRRVEQEFPARLEKAWRRFEQHVPDLKPGAQIFLLPAPRNAVGGAVRPLKDRDLVVFGAEEIATTLRTETGFDVLVQHELTHLYHQQVNAEMRAMVAEVYLPPYAAGRAKLYQVLWLEGLAVYTSRLLNPNAPDEEVLLSDRVAADVKARWPRLGAELRDHLDSTRKADIDLYLFDSHSGQELPRRTGYFVGMLVAQRLTKEYSYAKLCRLAGPKLRQEVDRALRDLEANGI
jgi:hypothetical protein